VVVAAVLEAAQQFLVVLVTRHQLHHHKEITAAVELETHLVMAQAVVVVAHLRLA
jgi:hypothetical protein